MTRVLLAIAILLPVAFAGAAAYRELARPQLTRSVEIGAAPPVFAMGGSLAVSAFDEWRPRITNVNAVDLDSDGKNDFLVCDAVRNAVWWCRQTGIDEWERIALTDEFGIAAPCHTSVVDIDQDSDPDILVAVLRSVWPTDRRVGQVILLENDGTFQFRAKILIDQVRRVTDVQAVDFDSDGDIDIAVAEFGYLHGSVFWMENDGDGAFTEHALISKSGAIHVPLADYDNDGDIDIAAVVSQDEEEVWLFDNDGAAGFTPHRVWVTPNFDLGCAGMTSADLDQDGDMDLVLSAGDNFEYVFPSPQPYHGCIWLENQGPLTFTAHRVGNVPGCYAAAVDDMDNDGDLDIVAGSMFNERHAGESGSLFLLRNDGRQSFETLSLGDSLSHISTLDIGDMNGDGRPDVIAGTLQTFEPFDDSAAVSIFFTKSEAR